MIWKSEKKTRKPIADTGTENKIFNERENPFHLFKTKSSQFFEPCVHVQQQYETNANATVCQQQQR